MADSSASGEIAIDNPDVPKHRKMFVPLENNPEVMTQLIRNLGLSPSLSFHDVFGIDDPSLLSFVPRPASALLLVFPVSKTYEQHRMSEDSSREEYNGSGDEEPVVWFRQTIGNSCGLMALLHGATNGSARDYIDPSSTLGTILKDAIPLTPTERADLLYNSPELEAAHQSSAQQGDTQAPGAADDIDLHYVAFVRAADGHLWELDGRRKGPIDRGVLDEGDDALSEKALDLGPRSFMQREAEGGEMRFSLVALGPSLD